MEVERYACQLRLIRWGLLVEADDVKDIVKRKAGVTVREDEDSDDADDEEEDGPNGITASRRDFTERCIAEARSRGESKTMAEQNEAVAQARKNVLKDFYSDIIAPRKCAQCQT